MDRRKDWLKELKVGDLVLISHRYHKSIGKVEKITPTGKIDVNGSRYNHNGWVEGSGVWRLAKLTSEVRLELANKNLITGIERNFDFIHRSNDLNTKGSRLASLDNKILGEFNRYMQAWREENDN